MFSISDHAEERYTSITGIVLRNVSHLSTVGQDSLMEYAGCLLLLRIATYIREAYTMNGSVIENMRHVQRVRLLYHAHDVHHRCESIPREPSYCSEYFHICHVNSSRSSDTLQV